MFCYLAHMQLFSWDEHIFGSESRRKQGFKALRNFEYKMSLKSVLIVCVRV